MKTITKTLVGTAATLAMAVGSVAPAAAQDRYRDRDRGGISTGEVIAGAVVLGGIAAVAAAASNDRNRYGYDDRDYRDRDYRDRNWDGRGSGWYNYDSNRRYGRGSNNPERAVSQCIRAAEREAERYGGGRADVTRIRDIDRERNGFEVTGTIQVSQRGWGNNRGVWNNNRRNTDSARFYCDYRRGQVVDIDFNGLNNRYR
ncbi:hypothetical protein [Alteraurantiacibacter buctensis]|uniref:17 kDa surface antigen n=1 Tax=Alteraurantiacibacter buctensis TaxID=1503981 RepID=A0A844Z0F8_9SPHN|nr:hypothetical protein [Alteraurantiacibacter buctensis]MXO71423.1 hypothetical protein [Alteraurantiacibacter buctensis]